jgi:hypothetical protein
MYKKKYKLNFYNKSEKKNDNKFQIILIEFLLKNFIFFHSLSIFTSFKINFIKKQCFIVF